MLKAVILLGGPQKGTRFRPLSFDLPKPLFPVSGLPIVQHHIEACLRIPNLKEILLLGYYPASEMASFVAEMTQEYKISIRYLQEYSCLGTAGGIYHFRDQIRRGNPEAFFVLNGDVCADFPLAEMLEFHQNRANNNIVTIMATEATRQQSMHYGCIVENKTTHEVQHYVEKPSTFVSNLINCGVYIFSLEVFQRMASVFYQKQQEYNDTSSVDKENSEREAIYLEQEILMPLAGTGKAHVYQTTKWWSQLKTPGAAIYANRHYLQLYKDRCPNRLATGEGIIGDVFIHPSANVHPTALLGPNVSIGKGATVRAGARIKESIVLGESDVREHALIMHSIIGWNSTVGAWTRVEGTPCDPNPDKAFAKMDNAPLFNNDGRLNPSITILGCNVTVPEEVIVLNSIVLPHKELTRSFKNEIIL